uniref:Nuclear RNA export factor 3 n=1 Tax=Ursus maritimus TaxID=29073 RepID=A0A452SY42_URSMA
MNKHYDVSQQVLASRGSTLTQHLLGHDIDIILNRGNCMAATLQIAEENFPELLSLNLSNNKPYGLDGLSDIIQVVSTVKILNLSKNEVKSAGELDQGKSLQPEEMSAGGSPPCTAFPDKSTNIRSVVHCVTLWDSELCLTVPVWRRQQLCAFGRGGGGRKLTSLLSHRYYLIYDSGDRQGLLGAYHNEACFSLAIPFNPGEPAASSLCEYFKENRNMKKLKDPSLRVQLLKRTKCDIMRSLCVLPKTQHDLSSFVVDMWFQTEMMLCFSVNGVFKEGVGLSLCPVSEVPFFPFSLCIVNDDLFVRDASPKETPSTVSIPVPTPSCSSWPTLCQKRQEMGQTFSTQSGMNLQWFQNQWDYIGSHLAQGEVQEFRPNERKLGGLGRRLRAPDSADLPTPSLHFLQAKHMIPEETFIQTHPGS